MASENEQEKPEVADAVIAEMRDEAAKADTEQYYTLDDAAESMREYANRLEAALKRERADHTCECAGIADLAAKEEAARHKPAWQALARIGDAIQQKMESSPCSVTEHERAIMNLCMRTFAEQSHRQQLFNEDKVRDDLVKKAYADSEKSGKCYEAIVRAVETVETAMTEQEAEDGE